MNSKYISILLPDLRGGGAERVNLDLAHEFSRLGHSVEFVLLHAKGEFLPEAEASFSVVDLRVSRSRQVPIAFARYLRQSRPDAIVASMWPLTSYAVLARLFSRHPCRLLLVEHVPLSVQYRGWGRIHRLALRLSLRFGCGFADAVAAVSEGAKNDLAKLAYVSPRRLHVLHNPIPLRPVPSEASMEQARLFWRGHGGVKILTVGSLKEQKNHKLLLIAFARVAQQMNAKLMLLGDGVLRAELEVLALNLGISDRVIFAGFQLDPTPFYQEADLFVLSSNYEGLPTVLIEALACSLPIVSTNCPSGPAEILMDGKYGMLVEVGDEVALANSMSMALSLPVMPNSLRKRALDFSPGITAARYLKLLI